MNALRNKQAQARLTAKISELSLSGNATIEDLQRIIDEAPKDTNTQQLKSYSAAEIIKTDYGKLEILINGLLHAGFALLVAAPKVGKSWLALSFCISISAGLPFWSMETNKAGALYLALEDSFRRVQSRLKNLLNGMTPPANLHIAIAAPDIDNGLITQIENHIKEYPDTKLIVVDVLQRVRSKRGNGGKNAYEADSAEMTKFKEIADRYNICLLCVHHNKIKTSDDPLMHISGSNGISGGADLIMLMAKEKRESNQATLSVISREMNDKQLEIEFDKTHCAWLLIGDTETINANKERDEYENNLLVKTIKALLRDNPQGVSRTAAELLNDMVTYFKTYEDYNAKSIGIRIKGLPHKLRLHDKILHIPPKSSKHRAHKFLYEFATHDTNDTLDTHATLDTE